MNETMNSLLSRRSIRKYKPDQITDAELKAVLEAGTYAPSGGNQQSALLIAVQDKETLAKLTAMNAAVIGKADVNPFYGAPTVILVLADRSKVTPVEDGSLALGNMMNAAHSLGLGTCWIHRTRQMFESEEGKALLKAWGVQGDYIGIGSCTLGHPDCPPPQAAPRKEGYVVLVK